MVMQNIPNGNVVGIFDPQETLDIAIKAAQALTRVVSQKKKPVIMNGEQYLEYEDWQTLGQFYGVTAITGDAVPVEVDGVKGAKATAKLVRLDTGEVVGGAEAYCMRDEEKWNTRPKYEWRDNVRVKIGDEPVPWFQLASMAQTRAGAKALRNRLAWIAVLGGYRPTPAEELSGSEGGGQQASKDEHWCKEHNTKFFKSSKMKSFAHPIGNTGEWCYKHTEKSEKAGSFQQDTAPDSIVDTKPKRDPSTLKDLNDMLKALKEDYNMQPKEVYANLNVKGLADITDSPAACYIRVAGAEGAVFTGAVT